MGTNRDRFLERELIAMSPAHEPWLVTLSLVMAFQGSYVGLHMARKIGAAQGTRRRAMITMSALSMALAIWTMHFVGMLAVRLPGTVDFLVLPTLLSFLVCVLVVGFAVFTVGTGTPTPGRIAFGSVLMGAGIVTMHYLGMHALHISIHMVHDPILVLASIAVGILASGLSLWLGFVPNAWRSTLLAAALMALAISAMHYTAMAGVTFVPHATGELGAPALSHGLLAIIVSVVGFVVSGLFLLTLVPERDGAPVVTAIAAPAPASPLPSSSVQAEAILIETDGPESAPHSSQFNNHLAVTTVPDEQPAPVVVAPARPSARVLPVEKGGRRHNLPVERVVAVQAQAHYTMLFDGEASLFCPLSISEVEAQLDPAIFARVHRSHIVNLDKLDFGRKGGEGGFLNTATEVPYRVPVSRAKRSWLKRRLQDRLMVAK